MRALTETQIIENLSPVFRPIYEALKRQKLYSGEQVLFAADYSGNWRSTAHRGFMIFTDQRYLETFEIGQHYGVIYFRSGSTWDKIRGQEVEERQWLDPGRLSTKINGSRPELPSLWVHDYSSVRGVVRNDYSIRHENKDLSLVELLVDERRIGNFYRTFVAQAGAIVFDLLNSVVRNGGRMHLKSKDAANEGVDAELLQLLKGLGNLHEAGILNDREFEQKKREVLSRL